MRRSSLLGAVLVGTMILLACGAGAQRTEDPLPPTRALETPRALPPTPANQLLSFMVLFGGMGVRLPTLADGDHMPSAWRNDLRQPFTIYTVACKTAEGTAEILPVLEPGGPTSILSTVCPCVADKWTLCAVNGFPVVHPYTETGAACPTPPCDLGVLVPKASAGKALRVSITGPVAQEK
jgi:hypothetical protein